VHEAGIYNVGAQVGMVILLLVAAIGNFYQPYLYERLAQLTQTAKMQIVKMTYAVILGLLTALLGLTVLAPPFFQYLVDEKYAKATRYVFWVGLGYFFWGIYILFSGFVFYQKQTKFLGILAIINVSVSIALNYWLINVFGPLGAAYASAISFFLVALIVIWKADRLFLLPWFSFHKFHR
jgi:O-antigen/teichoic acid export membrane protein